ncbi:MAG: hypothetical protein HC797_08660, partial [Anaerolineales bacterium]|nr:hypothetical protein [Anaerolineales bacterium]
EQDDAVAWLESLAAKHGAKPEELVTDPNKRSETPPDWVSQAQAIGSQPFDNAKDKPAQEEPAKHEPVDNALNIGEQFFAEFEKGSNESENDETGVWLRDLEAKGKQNESTDIPEWLSESEPETTDTSADLPNWLSDADNQPAQTEQLMGSQNLSDWLSGLDEEPGLELDPEILRASQRAPFPSPPAETPKNDVPDWLSNLDADKESEDDSWKPPVASAPTGEPVSPAETSSTTSAESLPNWLQNVESDSTEEHDDLPPWLHREQYETGSLPPQPKPTSPSDWQPVAQPNTGKPIQQNPPPPQPVVETPVVEKKKAPAKKAKAKKAEGQAGSGLLTQAKAELDRGDIPEALLHYGKINQNAEKISKKLSAI